MHSRLFFTLAAALGSLTPLIFDSALKGAVLLAAAACAALALWRASAAARHLVWLAAVVALLVVPVLTLALPQWRVLPGWADAEAIVQKTEVTPKPEGREGTPAPEVKLPALPSPSVDEDTLPAQVSAAEPPPSPVLPVPSVHPVPPVASVLTFRDWLPLAWAAGFGLLALRLLAAHLLLRRAAHGCRALTSPGGRTISEAFAAACGQLGIRQRVTLLLDEKRSIPVVWGVFRPRLMLPEEAHEWSSEQLRSVLLHELAHIKRRDALVQWITQIACALHWFNPLVWLAAWRLHAERERACDDLVLASGVRPSAYAEHLLHVATKLSPARWTAACGLAMARKSSLEGRLLAVLSEKLNRRGLTRALTAAALLLAAAVAIPIAMLRAADEKTEAKTGARLQPDTAAKLQWGERVNGLRMALAWPPVFDDAVLGKEPYFQLVVQNVSEKAVRFTAGEEAPNPRSMQYREGERIVQSLSDQDAQKADWQLQPGECGVLRLFSKEERNTDGKTISALIEGDLSKIGRYYAIALMEVAKAPPGAWTGKLVTGETRGSADLTAPPAPKHKAARALYEIWQRHARTNGDIPGALIGELAIGVRRFIHYNPTWETVPQLNAILTRLDATRDWKSADAIALLDEVAAVKDSPIDMALTDENDRVIAPGQPLPKELAEKPWIWSKEDASGLRIGWDLEPRPRPEQTAAGGEEWISTTAPGTALGARLFIHNAGKQPVVVRVATWHQGGVTAVNKDDQQIEVTGISWTTLARLVTHRLAPGEYVRINAPGVGIGKDAGRGPWAGPRVGWNLEAEPGDRVRLTHAPLTCDASHVGRREVDPIEDGPSWWTEFVKARLARGLTFTEKSDAITLPAPADRALLLDRACRDLFGTDPTAAERTAFDAVNSRATLFIFAEKLAQRPGITSFDGTLTPPHAWFEIQKPDPAAAMRPRVVLGPGEYPVSEKVTLKIVGRPLGDRRTNDAGLLFEATEATGKLPLDPHKLEVPDGWGTWAIVCRPGEGFFYLLHKGGVRRIDYTNPRKVTDTPATDLPAEFRDEVKRQLDIHEVAESEQSEIFKKAAAPAASPITADRFVKGPSRDPADPAKALPDSDPRTRTMLLNGNVRLRLPTLALDADEVEVVLKQGATGNENGKQPNTPAPAESAKGEKTDLPSFENITAKGRVRVMFVTKSGPAYVAGGGHMVYDALSGTFSLKDWPEAQIGDRFLRGRTKDSVLKLSGLHSDDPALDMQGFELLTLENKLTAADMPRTADKPVPPVNPAAASETDPERSIRTARFYEKKGNHAAAAIYYSEVMRDPASPHRDEARKSIARLVAADPALGEKFAHLIVNKLDPANEAQLDWGEAVNGLRGAVVVMHSAAAGEPPGIYLAVQNVSQAPLRFADTVKAEELRKLYVSDSKGILFALTNGEPTQTDVVLQPREVTYLSMMLADESGGEKSPTAALIEGLRKDSLQTWKAVMEIKAAPEGAWKGRLTTAETRGAIRVNGPQPKDAKAQALFKLWQSSARLNGDIPGGLLALLHNKVKEFIRNNTGDASGDPFAKKLAPLETRFGVAGDWKPQEVVALLDDIAAVTTIPLETTMDHITRNTLQPGQQLPAAYAKADWGTPLEGGLRMACVLEPRAAEYPLGTEVKARFILHNSGDQPVAFITRSFDQPGHKAKNADGQDYKIDSTDWSTLGRPQAYRLAPGEYCEVNTPGLGIGKRDNDRDDWANVRAGSWILCEAGDEVTFLPGGTQLTGPEGAEADPDWWLNFITERLNREAPVPLDTKERGYLLYRVVRELFGTAPSTTEGDAFAADKSPDALKNLAVLLTKHAYGKQCHGTIHPGETKFRVLPPDPDAAKRPRVANSPGWYSLSDSVKFSVTRRPAGARVVNEASIIYFQQGKDNVVHKVELPDGYNTWAAGLKKGENVLWIAEKGALWRYDFTNPAQVHQTLYGAGAGAPIPADVREAISAAIDVPDAPKQTPEPPGPAPDRPAAPATEKPNESGAASPPAEPSANPPGIARMVQPPGRMSEAFAAHCLKVALARQMAQWKPDDVIAWGKEEDGLRSGVVMERKAVRGTPLATWLLIRNVSGETKEFTASPVPNRIEARARTADGKLLPLHKVLLSGVDPFYKIVLRPGETLEFEGVPVVFGLEKNTDGTPKTPKWPICGFETDAAKVLVSFPLNNVHAPATGEMEVKIVAAGPEDAPASGNNGAAAPAADDSYAPVGVINTDLPEGDWDWSEEQNGLRVGLKVADRDWRIGGEVKVELWVCNAAREDEKFHHSPRRDIGLRVKLRSADGKEHDATIAQFRGRPAFAKHLLKAGHAFKAKEFSVQLAKLQKPTPEPWFDLPAGEYQLRCEVDIPGTTATDAAGKKRIPAEGEWSGTIKSGEVAVNLLRPE